ncbi:TlpA disulfide reductase family protein [Sphingobacterium corticibacter]|uniref:Thioredoxin domain-containing protein n=1 Tax=Sphingobacterium corticibacter TaxID=2171749 RepID=A0A2T8HIN6_9SPHI|nr:TlpA disulfide reductase family protein [Sphingobacterium corticibacter]PVH25182.1 hypothetical protein DC487_09660 [Sphingobacterium corticibacter]
MKSYILFISYIFLTLPSVYGKIGFSEPRICRVSGIVIDRPYSTELILIKEGDDPRFPLQNISVKNGAFSFELNSEEIESYELVFADELAQGLSKPIVFFAESGSVTMELYALEIHRKNKLSGTPNNNQLDQYNRLMNQKFPFWQLEEMINEAENQLLSLLEPTADSGKKPVESSDRHTDLIVLQKMEVLDSLEKEYENQYADYLAWMIDNVRNRNDLIGLRDLNKLLILAGSKSKTFLKVTMADLESLYWNQYQANYASSELSNQIDTYLKAHNSIFKGAKYIDFEAQDFNGKTYRLSELLNGKVTIVHFWGSWCLPCRKKGIELISLYDDFKSKGLEIVGVARERSLNDGIQAANRDGYPWLNLIELNDKNGIWEKYKMSNSGGDIFVFDHEGKIMTYSVDVEALRAMLTTYLN